MEARLAVDDDGIGGWCSVGVVMLVVGGSFGCLELFSSVTDTRHSFSSLHLQIIALAANILALIRLLLLPSSLALRSKTAIFDKKLVELLQSRFFIIQLGHCLIIMFILIIRGHILKRYMLGVARIT
ncbi:hypothetical protein G6F42_019226 [Rhizopus arrhizus]|nr:hypothetical protein G6F42_019226 [Rhizopus arrhizus]